MVFVFVVSAFLCQTRIGMLNKRPLYHYVFCAINQRYLPKLTGHSGTTQLAVHIFTYNTCKVGSLRYGNFCKMPAQLTAVSEFCASLVYPCFLVDIFLSNLFVLFTFVYFLQ